ncbi:hypothetical protein RJ641_022757 [Dillenia turbinata]|uniref:HMA domain-containing protein n=1 Tax=Dillenia turbinata TaxID=194707 RepID=A0AAN8YU74_9MAGN
MATISAFSSLYSVPSLNSQRTFNSSLSCSSSSSFSSSRPTINFHVNRIRKFHSHLAFGKITRPFRKLRSVEEETLIPEAEENSAVVEEERQTQTDQTVSVPVSPSDILTMFFQAEGTIADSAIPTVTKALENTEGVSNLKVQVLAGIASIELKKQTTIQATGVASSLVETIQGSGFKLQTLNLSFEDEEDILN